MQNLWPINAIHLTVGWLFFMAGSVPGLAGERLYNGITLPSQWPPEIRHYSREPMPVPYLKSLPEVVPVDLGRQLFVDDFLIEQTTLRRSFHEAELHPDNPVLKPDKPWEARGEEPRDPPAAMPFSDGIWYDPQDGLFKMWYYAGYGRASCTCYAKSRDGIHWEKPELDVVPGTNIVHPGSRDSATVWLDLNEKDPQRRYKMMRRDNTKKRHAIHFSADGIHLGEPVVWAGEAGDRTTFFYNPFRSVWVFGLRGGGYFKGYESAAEEFDGKYDEESGSMRTVRFRRYREGRDFLATAQSWPATVADWLKAAQRRSAKSIVVENAQSPVLSSKETDLQLRIDKPGLLDIPTMWVGADRLDPPRADIGAQPQLYNLDAVPYESVLLGLFSIWRGHTDDHPRRCKINAICLGFSWDGFHWDRPSRKAFIGVSEDPRSWRYSNIQSAGGGCLVVGDKLYFYVSGRNVRDVTRCKDEERETAYCSTGLATLRRDGFASMDAGPRKGTLTTRPIRFAGKYLFVNVDAPNGELRVEVLDESGRVIDPYTRINCIAIRCDSTIKAVQWKGGQDLSKLSDTPVRLRFHLGNGKLYSFWVSPDRSGASHGYVAAGGPGFSGPTDTVGAATLTKGRSHDDK